MKTVVCQLWTESERGWGTRSDGYSLHLNNSQRVNYIKKYNNKLPERVNGMAPDIYTFADGDGYLVEIDDELFNLIQQAKNGCMFYDNPPKKI